MCLFPECGSHHSGRHVNNAAEFIPIEPPSPWTQWLDHPAVGPTVSIVLRYRLPISTTFPHVVYPKWGLCRNPSTTKNPMVHP